MCAAITDNGVEIACARPLGADDIRPYKMPSILTVLPLRRYLLRMRLLSIEFVAAALQ